MKTSAHGIGLIKRFEGLALDAYHDVAGILTIGYGHTGAEVAQGLVWTEQVAEAALTRDLEFSEEAINRLVTAPLNQNEFDALVSFVYNVGVSAFKNSTALKRLNAGDRLGAAEALTWWDKATVDGVRRRVKGLTSRRAVERDLFLRSIPQPSVSVTDDEEGCVAAPGNCVEVSITPPCG